MLSVGGCSSTGIVGELSESPGNWGTAWPMVEAFLIASGFRVQGLGCIRFRYFFGGDYLEGARFKSVKVVRV